MTRKKTAGTADTKTETAEQLPASTVTVPDSKQFPIVGIGASAGGLAAFEAFFSGMPPDKNPDMAFVLVQHLAPDHKSILAELIRNYTRMKVFEVVDGVVVQPNCAYIIPPGRDMAFLNGTLQLMEPTSPRGQRLPIDFFFRSLAQDQHERAICIVLSGTGSDGTLGVRAIKGEGGMAMAQNPESTEYDGMPRSAIATGLVDYILPTAEMPEQLIAYVTHAFGKRQHPLNPPLPITEDYFKKIFVLLRVQTGHDFSQYKQNTIKRRVDRRMSVHQIDNLNSYVRFLQQTPVEIEALFRDLLIGVTNFFRDPEAFAGLENKVIAQLFTDRAPGTPIRVWICGCSTGEEAYSVAMLLQEQMDKLKTNHTLQIFATDIDNRAIDQARSGLYPASISSDITPERLARFFTPVSDGSAFRINKSIRDLMVFSEQDVIKDPPFSRLDLICCRNLLIYLNSDLQKKLIPLFHYALNPGGMLFLGTSETIGEFLNLFSVIDRQAKLYRRNEDLTNKQRFQLGHFNLRVAGDSELRNSVRGSGGGKISLREVTERILLERYAPTSILVSERGEMLYIHGSTGRYLQMASGEPNVNILKMAREGLKRDLTAALYQAIKNKIPVERSGLRVKTNGDYSKVNLTVLPVLPTSDSLSELVLYLIVIVEIKEEQQDLAIPGCAEATVAKPVEKLPEGTNTEGLAADALIITLKQELRAKEEYLKSANEELETSNEELKSSNEEMQSINEELQSTNEELETSKEELQSVNEELTTVNSELQIKVLDLSRANNDMNNLLAGTGVGTIFVDFQLLIQRFTPSVTQVINLIPSDVGRPVSHLVSNLVGYNTLVEDIKSVLDTLIPQEIEVSSKDGTWFLLRIRPYRTLENVIEGAVITFFDISEIKRAREALQKANDLLRLAAVVVFDSHDAVVLQDLDGRILAWNPAANRMYGWSEEEALVMNIRQLIPEELRKEAWKKVQTMSHAETVTPYRTQRLAKNGSKVDVWMTATALLDESGQMYAIATTERANAIVD